MIKRCFEGTLRGYYRKKNDKKNIEKKTKTFLSRFCRERNALFILNMLFYSSEETIASNNFAH